MKQNQYSIPSIVATTLIAVGILGFLALGVHPVPVALGLIGIVIHLIRSRRDAPSAGRIEPRNNPSRWNGFFPLASLMPIFVVLGLSAWLSSLAIDRLEYSLTQESEGYGSAIFTFFIAPISVVTIIGLALVPSVKMFRKSRRKIDLAGVILSSTLLVLIVIAWIVFEPLRKHLIFDR